MTEKKKPVAGKAKETSEAEPQAPESITPEFPLPPRLKPKDGQHDEHEVWPEKPIRKLHRGKFIRREVTTQRDVMSDIKVLARTEKSITVSCKMHRIGWGSRTVRLTMPLPDQNSILNMLKRWHPNLGQKALIKLASAWFENYIKKELRKFYNKKTSRKNVSIRLPRQMEVKE